MKLVIASILLFALAAAAEQKFPRPAPEFSFNVPNGGQVALSQFRGKVVCLELLFTTCPHCQHASQLMSKLQTEYGPRGFQALGVAFNDMANMLVPDFVRDYRVNYPVGYTTRAAVHGVLQHDPKYGLHVPQIVLIDRKGVIRHQSQPRGDATSATEPFLRQQIESLLKEPAAAPAKTTSKKPSRKAA